MRITLNLVFCPGTAPKIGKKRTKSGENPQSRHLQGRELRGASEHCRMGPSFAYVGGEQRPGRKNPTHVFQQKVHSSNHFGGLIFWHVCFLPIVSRQSGVICSRVPRRGGWCLEGVLVAMKSKRWSRRRFIASLLRLSYVLLYRTSKGSPDRAGVPPAPV